MSETRRRQQAGGGERFSSSGHVARWTGGETGRPKSMVSAGEKLARERETKKRSKQMDVDEWAVLHR